MLTGHTMTTTLIYFSSTCCIYMIFSSVIQIQSGKEQTAYPKSLTKQLKNNPKAFNKYINSKKCYHDNISPLWVNGRIPDEDNIGSLKFEPFLQ